MRSRFIFVSVVVGFLIALDSAYVYAVPSKPLPPAFDPATNAYPQGIYANGIIESFQSHGENISLYPEVAGTVVKVLVTEGETVEAGAPLLQLDESVQQALVEQQRAQAEAAHAMLDELHAQPPRKEALEVSSAQVDAARATLKSADDALRSSSARSISPPNR